ncbi:MAG: hypothetical protein V8T86_00320 [Victivallis sp.]
MFGFRARWAAPEQTRNAPSYHAWSRAKPELEAWKRYVETTARHFRGRIRIWQIWMNWTSTPSATSAWRTISI